MDDFIKQLAQKVILRLEQLEEEAGFSKLEKVSEDSIKDEAKAIRKEIRVLKNRLSQLQETSI